MTTTTTPVGIKEAHRILGGKLFCDPHPYYREDSELWLKLLSIAATKGIGLYGTLTKLRAIGATLEKDERFGYLIKPIIKGEKGEKWGWANQSLWEAERRNLLPYTNELMKILKEI